MWRRACAGSTRVACTTGAAARAVSRRGFPATERGMRRRGLPGRALRLSLLSRFPTTASIRFPRARSTSASGPEADPARCRGEELPGCVARELRDLLPGAPERCSRRSGISPIEVGVGRGYSHSRTSALGERRLGSRFHRPIVCQRGRRTLDCVDGRGRDSQPLGVVGRSGRSDRQPSVIAGRGADKPSRARELQARRRRSTGFPLGVLGGATRKPQAPRRTQIPRGLTATDEMSGESLRQDP